MPESERFADVLIQYNVTALVIALIVAVFTSEPNIAGGFVLFGMIPVVGYRVFKHYTSDMSMLEDPKKEYLSLAVIFLQTVIVGVFVLNFALSLALVIYALVLKSR